MLKACEEAVTAFVGRWTRSAWDNAAIVRRAQVQFSKTLLRALYRAAIQ